MSRHSLTDNSFQSGQTYPVLVLQKLAYRTDTPVAKVVDIISAAQTVFQMNIIINGSKNIFLGIAVNKMSNVYHHVGQYFLILFLCLYINIRNSRILNLIR